MTKSDAQRRQIYHQGCWDGACFLYSIANAYKALTGSKVTREKWDRALEHVPNPLGFLGGIGATRLSYEEAVGLIEAMLDAFSDPDERFKIDQLDHTATTADICREISLDAVVLFAFAGPTEVHHPRHHIACGVATSAEPAVLHIACSAAFSSRHLRDGEYFERFHPSVGRYSNDSIAIDSPVQVGPNWRWRITLTSPATETTDPMTTKAGTQPTRRGPLPDGHRAALVGRRRLPAVSGRAGGESVG
jgi:hypothetical protein